MVGQLFVALQLDIEPLPRSRGLPSRSSQAAVSASCFFFQADAVVIGLSASSRNSGARPRSLTGRCSCGLWTLAGQSTMGGAAWLTASSGRMKSSGFRR